MTELAFQPDVAAVSRDGGLGNCQAETNSVARLVRLGLGPVEPLEHMGQMLGGNSDASVLDLDPYARTGWKGSNCNASASGRSICQSALGRTGRPPQASERPNSDDNVQFRTVAT